MRLLTFLMTNIVTLINDFCFGSRRTALIHHPHEAMRYFMETRERCDYEESVNVFKRLSMAQREATCLDIFVDSISFSEPPNNADYMEGNTAKKITRTFQKYTDFEIHDEALRSYFHYKHEQFNLLAHRCIILKSGLQWAIANSCRPEIFFLLLKSATSSEFKIFGLSETIPRISTDMTQRHLDNLYTTGRSYFIIGIHKTPDENKLEKRSLHLLHDIQKFRLCAIAYVAVKELKKKKCSRGNFVNNSEDKENAEIIIDDPEKGERSFLADLISCAINKNWQNPQFFVTSDPFSEDSVFVVKPSRERKNLSGSTEEDVEKEDRGITYKLMLHLKPISFLETSFSEA